MIITFTYPDAAALLGISERSLRNAKNAGRIGYVKLGRRVEFTREQLDEFVRSRMVDPR